MTKDVTEMSADDARAELDKIYSSPEAPVPGAKPAKGKKAAKPQEEPVPQEEEPQDDPEEQAADAGEPAEADPEAGDAEEEPDIEEEKETRKSASLERALQEERRKRQDLERQMAQGGRFAPVPPQNGQYYPQNPMMMQPQPAKPDPEPDFNTDPDAWYRWNHNRQNQTISKLESALKPALEAVQQQNAEMELSVYEQDLADRIPDYPQAKLHYINAEAARWRALGYPLHVAMQEARKSVLTTAGGFFAQGVNPAEGFYNYVKSAYNWNPTPPKAQVPLNRQRELKERASTVVAKGGDAVKSKAYSLDDLLKPDVWKKVPKEKREAMINDYYKNPQ